MVRQLYHESRLRVHADTRSIEPIRKRPLPVHLRNHAALRVTAALDHARNHGDLHDDVLHSESPHRHKAPVVLPVHDAGARDRRDRPDGADAKRVSSEREARTASHQINPANDDEEALGPGVADLRLRGFLVSAVRVPVG